MLHNADNDYTLLVYQDVGGEARHVLRRGGICELVVTYATDGTIWLEERGYPKQAISSYEAGQITDRLNALLDTRAPVTRPARSI